MTKKTLLIVGGFALMLALFMGSLVTAHDEAATISFESPVSQIHSQAEALAKDMVQAARGIDLAGAIRETSQRLQLMGLLKRQEVERPLASLTALNEVANTFTALTLDSVLATLQEREDFASAFATDLSTTLRQLEPLDVFTNPRSLLGVGGQEMADFLRMEHFGDPMPVPAIP